MSDLSSHDVPALLALHAAVSRELRDRGVTRSANNPVGDLAEHLFCRAFGWKLSPKSMTNADAVNSKGEPIQVKARRVTPENSSRQLGQLRDLQGKHFLTLAAILFDETYHVTKAALIPHARVVQFSRFVERTYSWRFLFRDSVMTLPDVEDVTKHLQETELAWAEHL